MEEYPSNRTKLRVYSSSLMLDVDFKVDERNIVRDYHANHNGNDKNLDLFINKSANYVERHFEGRKGTIVIKI